jgi:hypothetical protein
MPILPIVKTHPPKSSFGAGLYGFSKAVLMALHDRTVKFLNETAPYYRVIGTRCTTWYGV